jgi:PAS domain S-box-containing protein/putative nucleotidyltransferase with HDIG domain
LESPSAAEHPGQRSEKPARGRTIPEVLALGASAFVALLGGVVLLGWTLGIRALENAAPAYVAMKPNTAVCFVLMGAALALLGPVANSRRRRTLGLFVVAGAGIVAVLTTSEYVLGIDLGIDQVLFTIAPGAVATSNLGRMAPNTALDFVLLAGALACLDPGARWRQWGGPALALGAAVVAGIALVGYLSNVTSLYAGSHLTQMPIATAVGFLVLAVGIFCARPSHGPMRLLTSDTVGGTVARVLFPAAIGLPFLLGALRFVGEAAELFETNTGIWLLVVSIIGLAVPLSWALGASLDRAELERRRGQALGREAQRDRVAFEEAPIGSVITDRHGRIERVNQAFCRMTGHTPDELIGTHFLELTHPEDRDRSAAVVAAMLSGAAGTQRFEKRYVHRSGRVIEARIALTTIRDEGGEVAQLFAQIEDITDALRTTRELEEAQFEMLARLAAAAEFHDDDTSQHTRRVGELSVTIADHLGLPDAQLDLIRLAAPLHDIGKIAIPDAVLGKPGKLTTEEFEHMKTHTTVGAQMLAGSAFALLEMAEQIALTHHEKWDGSGYPAGLAGEAIPISGRIVAVADVFDALTHSRPYKPAWSTADAIDEMTSQAGRHFDPQVLEAFLSSQSVQSVTANAQGTAPRPHIAAQGQSREALAMREPRGNLAQAWWPSPQSRVADEARRPRSSGRNAGGIAAESGLNEASPSEVHQRFGRPGNT